MPRLIDANDLLMENSWAFYDENGNRNEACIAVENAPTVDAVPVVRCKDCRWQNTSMCWIKNRQLLDDYDFCCGGLRREDAETD